jgi:hypothetical protein
LALLISFGLVTEAEAQDVCSQILQYGIWDTQDTSDNTFETRKVANWACSASNRNAGGSFAYGEAKLDFTSSGANNSCSSTNEGYTLSREAKENIKKVSKDLVASWVQCMSRFGSYASVLFRDDPHQFTLQLQTHGPQGNTGHAKFGSNQQFTCTRPKNDLIKGVAYRNGISIS